MDWGQTAGSLAKRKVSASDGALAGGHVAARRLLLLLRAAGEARFSYRPLATSPRAPSRSLSLFGRREAGDRIGDVWITGPADLGPSPSPRLGSSAVVVASEDRGEGLVRLAYRGDGCGGSRDAAGLQTPLRWGTPRRKTADPGPSPAGEWMICGSGGLARTSRTSWRTATLGPRRPSPVNEQNHAAAGGAVSKWFP